MTEICYNNFLRGSTILEDETITNFGAANALDGRTSSQAGFLYGAARYVRFNIGSLQTISRICIAGHNLGTVGATIKLFLSTNNASFTEVVNETLSDNYVQVFDFTPTSAQYVRIQITGHSADAYISDIFVGDELDLPLGIPVGFVPPDQSDQDVINSAMTGNGALAGITVTPRPKRCKVQLLDYEASWFATNWASLVASLKLYPVYFLWDTGKQAFYCTPYKKIGEPAYSKGTRQSVTLDLEGFIE